MKINKFVFGRTISKKSSISKREANILRKDRDKICSENLIIKCFLFIYYYFAKFYLKKWDYMNSIPLSLFVKCHQQRGKFEKEKGKNGRKKI